MINLIEAPQQSDIYKTIYSINDDILTAKINDIEEVFDFSGLEEGIAEEIVAEFLPVNPILSAEKVGDTINIKVIRLYTFKEKELFENGYN